MGFREGGGGVQIDPPSVSWFLSTPAGIGLTHLQFNQFFRTNFVFSTFLKIENIYNFETTL